MSLPVVFRHIARQEIDNSIAWYESERPGFGAEFTSEVERVLIRIAESPKQFRRIRGEVRRAVLRRFPYTIDFLLEPTQIVVLAVFHVKRNPMKLENRKP